VFEKFDTDVLLIRKIVITDANSIYDKWAQEIDVARYTTWKTHKSKHETQSYVEQCIKNWDRNSYTWIIESKESSEIIGSFAARESGHKVDIGYLLALKWWGQGIMTSVVTSFIDECFKINSIERIGAVCDVENPASKRVMEKSGMSYEGILLSWMVHPNMGSTARDCYSLSTNRADYS